MSQVSSKKSTRSTTPSLPPQIAARGHVRATSPDGNARRQGQGRAGRRHTSRARVRVRCEARRQAGGKSKGQACSGRAPRSRSLRPHRPARRARQAAGTRRRTRRPPRTPIATAPAVAAAIVEAPASEVVRVVTDEDIRIRAYFLSIEHRARGGSDIDFWLIAERELRHGIKAKD